MEERFRKYYPDKYYPYKNDSKRANQNIRQ